MFIAECAFCKHQVRAPEHAVGASVVCPKCGNPFTVAPIEHASPRIMVAAEAPRVVATPGPKGPAGLDATRLDHQDAADLPMPPDVVTSPHVSGAPSSAPAWLCRVHPVGLAALVLASVALACASLPGLSGLTRVLAGGGLLTGLVAVAMCLASERPYWLFPIAASSLAAVVLTLALFFPAALGPVYEAWAQRSSENADEVQIIPLRSNWRPADVSADGWADAMRAVVQQGHIRVQVAGASIGKVRLRAAKPTFTKENYLTIQLRLVHVGSAREIEFQHWGDANADRATELPTLTDAAGNGCAWQTFEPSMVVLGQARRASLHPGQFADDVLVFAVPKTGAELKTDLRLELPAAAWGGRGVVRFTIPAAMFARPKT
jgi:hypothetical protein